MCGKRGGCSKSVCRHLLWQLNVCISCDFSKGCVDFWKPSDAARWLWPAIAFPSYPTFLASTQHSSCFWICAIKLIRLGSGERYTLRAVAQTWTLCWGSCWTSHPQTTRNPRRIPQFSRHGFTLAFNAGADKPPQIIRNLEKYQYLKAHSRDHHRMWYTSFISFYMNNNKSKKLHELLSWSLSPIRRSLSLSTYLFILQRDKMQSPLPRNPNLDEKFAYQ